ncbi:MAG: hypothetical protein ACRC62_22465 [Microcoleus sp.]
MTSGSNSMFLESHYQLSAISYHLLTVNCQLLTADSADKRG